MIDRDKLIKALRHCALVSNTCDECPYDEICRECPTFNVAMLDAAKL